MAKDNNLKYITVPVKVLCDDDIPPRAKLLLGLFIPLVKQNGFCYANNKYLSDFLHVSKRLISKYITLLKDKKYINVIYELERRKIYLEDIY